MFGSAPPPQNEDTPFHPRSPYACAKVFGHHITVNYRESYGLHASSGILFNHESPRRGETFVTRKITRAVAHIKLGLQEKLYLGNLDARRDWGLRRRLRRSHVAHAAAGRARRLRHRHRRSAYRARIRRGRLRARRPGLAANTCEIDPRYFRPAEVDYLRADASKARRVLGWEPRVGFRELVRIMVDADMRAAELAGSKGAGGAFVGGETVARRGERGNVSDLVPLRAKRIVVTGGRAVSRKPSWSRAASGAWSGCSATSVVPRHDAEITI